MPNAPQPLIDRLRRYSDVAQGKCWIWNGQRDKWGYGRIIVYEDRERKCRLVHRIAFGLFNPNWLGDTQVLHDCDTPACWNPDHLFSGTQADNMADMKAKGRAKKGDTSGENNGNAKLTWEKVRQIRACFSAHESREAICATFAIPRYTLNQIARGGTWKE